MRPLEGEGVIDLRGRRNYQLRRTHYLGSGARDNSLVTTNASGFTTDLRSGAVYPMNAALVTSTNRGIRRTFPHMLLQLAAGRAGTLRSLGTIERAGRKEEGILFTDADGTLITLWLDAQTAVPARSEGIADDALEGLVGTETAYSDYRRIGGILVPFHAVTTIGPHVTSDLTYSEIRLDTHPDATLFEPVAGAIRGPEIGGPPAALALDTLGRDVYYVKAIATSSIFFYGTMFVVFDDYVMVIEAPLSDGVSQVVIAKIHEIAPGKPIRYVVPTHYHIDHTGGIRGYVAEGSTIVTTPGNRKFFEQVASVSHPLFQDRLSAQPRPAIIETFRGSRVFSDAHHRVELYEVGPTPHVDEIVFAYLPESKVAFVSDLFLVSFMGKLGPAESLNHVFYDKVRQLGLNIGTIGGGQGGVGTWDELARVIAESPSP